MKGFRLRLLLVLMFFAGAIAFYKLAPVALPTGGSVTLLSQEDRSKAHMEAEAFIMAKHFYRNGRGIVAAGIASKTVAAENGLVPVEAAELLAKTRWGLIQRPGQTVPNGLFPVREQGVTLTVAGCVLCHSGKAAGVPIVGLGNKTIDISLIARDLLKEGQISNRFREVIGSADPRQKFSVTFLKSFTSGDFGNLTQGLVPSARIRAWFYQMAGRAVPTDEARAQVKVPHWWGLAEKLPAGIDWDGYGAGVGWALGVELAAGQTVATATELVSEAEELIRKIGQLLPPRYPFAIDSAKAAAGKALFERSCSQCHGQYTRDSLGYPLFRTPMRVSQRIVGTDPDRLRGNTPLFAEMVDKNPFGQWMKRGPGGLDPDGGYIAPRLEGIWARFPYLHNASVPTLADLFVAPTRRPQYWSLRDAGEAYRFSQERVGLSLPTTTIEKLDLKLRAERGDREIYSVQRVGHSNQGHWFPEMQGLTEAQIGDLLEYLKTL